MKRISHRELLSLVHYNPHTGVFTSLVHRKKVHPGDVVGNRNSRGYMRTTIHGKFYFLHRLAWFYTYGSWPKKVDHKNGKYNDNRIKNLRQATTRQNGRNRKVDVRNVSGATGVCWVSKIGKFRVDIKLKHGRFVLGNFIDSLEACLLRLVAEDFFFGKFQRSKNED